MLYLSILHPCVYCYCRSCAQLSMSSPSKIVATESYRISQLRLMAAALILSVSGSAKHKLHRDVRYIRPAVSMPHRKSATPLLTTYRHVFQLHYSFLWAQVIDPRPHKRQKRGKPSICLLGMTRAEGVKMDVISEAYKASLTFCGSPGSAM